MKILLIGAYPPPIGGNSVHIQRLFERLQDSGCAVQVLDYLGGAEVRGATPPGVTRLPSSCLRRLWTLWRFSRTVAPETLVHFHVSALGRFKWIAPLLLWLFRRHEKVLTIHSGSFVAQASRLPRAYLRRLCRAFDTIIPVNIEQEQFLASLGVPTDRLRLIPAYLPAMPATALVPATVAARIPGRIVLVTSGDLTPTYQYGPLIDCLKHLDPARYLIVFAFYGRSQEPYAKQVLERLAQYPHAIVVRDQSPEVFVSLLAVTNAYVRLTTTDGDSVAIREALALGKIALASDAVPRPAGCQTFALNEPDSLARLIATIPNAAGKECDAMIDDSNFRGICEAYGLSQTAGKDRSLAAA